MLKLEADFRCLSVTVNSLNTSLGQNVADRAMMYPDFGRRTRRQTDSQMACVGGRYMPECACLNVCVNFIESRYLHSKARLRMHGVVSRRVSRAFG